MCGICGKLSWDEPPSADLIARMNGRLAHRGPDAEGVFREGPVALGHRRLSIIDTSAAGNQPMSDASGTLWIVFNGEVYNFQTLRDELRALGAEFRTRTDTEVILAAYSLWGEDCMRRFNGMFAFALWDSRAEKLLLARDRLGKKPLFYAPLPGGGIVFASELKALALDPAVPRRLNPRAVGHFLSLNYTLTSECIFEGVRKLEAAHYLVLERGKPPRTVRYWDLARCFIEKRKFRSEAEAAEELAALLDDSVRLRMISDVPLGAFLSGGVDSSAIAAAMARIGSPESTLTFSIGFSEKSYSELPEVRFAADLLRVVHRDRVVEADMAALLPEMVWFADEPFADSSMIPTYCLAQFTRQFVTVSLSGDGGDEIFAGYPTYDADRIYNYFRRAPAPVVRALGLAADRLLPVSFDKVSFDYKARQFLRGHGLPPGRAHYFWREIFSEEEKSRLLAPDVRAGADAEAWRDFEKYEREVAQCHYLDRSMYVDIKTWLVDDILVKVDRMTMAHSLEARAPLLDYRIVEFAASLPPGMKMKGFRKKHIFKESQKRRLPAAVLDRPKRGFNAPVSHWIGLSMGDYLDKIVAGRAPGADAVFDRGAVAALWDEHRERKRDNGLKLFSIINLGLWLEKFMC